MLTSTLFSVYTKLSKEYNFDLALSGILLDGLFRGHGGYPGIIDEDLFNIFKVGRIKFNDLWEIIFLDNYKSF